MVGIILAGGQGTRLLPLTKTINKHMLPVGDVPMIVHPLTQMLKAGITEIMIVSSPDHIGDIIKYLGSGLSMGCRITYRVQESANGIAGALAVADGFSDDDCCVMLGDNIFIDDISHHIASFRKGSRHCRLFLKEMNDVSGLGVVKWNGPCIEDIVEKAALAPSNHAVLGCYCYKKSVFDNIKTIKPSPRGELEITDLNRCYLGNGMIDYKIVDGRWIDAGTLVDYARANSMMFHNLVNKVASDILDG